MVGRLYDWQCDSLSWEISLRKSNSDPEVLMIWTSSSVALRISASVVSRLGGIVFIKGWVDEEEKKVTRS